MNRILFRAITRPKAAAKHICAATGVSLSTAQRTVARISGYRDWHDLETSLSSGIVNPATDEFARPVVEPVGVAKLLAEELHLTSGDALYALGISRLIELEPTTIRQQIVLQTNLFRLRELPAAPRRQRGAAGRLKSPGWNGEIVILKSFGKPTHIITHQSARALCADFEFMTPRQSPDLFIPMRLYLAYGVWTERDGAQVLFSRDYSPMWRIRKGRTPERMNPWERIDFVKQEWFWKDRWPWRDKAMHEAEIDRLHEYGVRFLPRLIDVLPLVVFQDNLDFREAIEQLKPHKVDLPAA